jgi:hypothetical protein
MTMPESCFEMEPAENSNDASPELWKHQGSGLVFSSLVSEWRNHP